MTACKEVQHWFDGSMQALNETDILFGNGRSARPDRVMIGPNNDVIIVDYKFGEQKDTLYQRRVEQYASLIREMGYKNVFGYLWYISLQEIKKCFF
jgi:RecB family exonuclease